MSSFNGKSVLALGGSRGIGVTIVHCFAADDTSITFTCSSSPDATKALTDKTDTRITQADSTDRNAVINRVRESGPLDVLVVNAGIILSGDTLEQDPGDVERLFQISVHSPYYATMGATRQTPGGEHIIIIDSVNGDRMPFAGLTSYVVSKSALQGLARGPARDFGPRSVTVSVVQPGSIDTDANPENSPLKEVMHSFMALKRYGRPEEVAGMVA